MTIPILIAAAGIALMFVFLGERIHGCSPVKVVMKAAVSLFFVMTALAAFALTENDRGYGFFIIIGLLFGLTGDIWLDLKYVVPEASKVFTYVGFIAFSIGHLFYNLGIVGSFLANAGWVDVAVPVGISLASAAGVALFSEKTFKVKYGEYKIITVIYSAIVISFTAFSFTAALHTGFATAPVMLLVSSVMFLISDGILNVIYFGKPRWPKGDIFFNHLLYYIAQFMIALSLCFAES